ncbi:MAG: ABC transporter permease [Tepidiformaceae bacterium]
MATSTYQGGDVIIAAPRKRSPTLQFTIRLAKQPVAAVSLVLIFLIVFSALFANVVSPFDPIRISRDTFQSPSLSHPMGTDDLGRDMFSRIIHGARISLYVGLVSVFVGVFLGSTVGLISGTAGGLTDLLVQRVVDAMLAFPALVLTMALVSVFGASTSSALIAIAIVFIPGTSRIVRSAVLSVKQNMYIEAARSVGATNMRIMLRHILPNVMAPILILISAYVGAAILIEASLSFLGLGTQPPNPSWGLMLSGTGRRYMEEAPWMAIFPGIAISLTVLAFNMLGDVLRDMLDPRLRAR